MSYLTLDGLAKHFAGHTAVDGLSLSIEKGEFLSLLGPSGCGKTTTLQMVAGFVDPSRGRIVLDGRDVTGLRPEKRGMGVVFQSYALFPHMTVAENVGFGLEMRKVPGAERDKRVAETLELVRLGGLGNRHPKALSGGQRQRVALARALAIRPAVLLLDEPMSNLDAKLREEMHIELRAIQKHLGITTILVTHDQVEAMTMSDRVAVMHGGRIVQLGTPFDAYERPQSAFASSFLGQTNKVAARVVAMHDDCCEVALGDRGASRSMFVPHEGQRYAGAVDVYLRPERIRVVAAGEGIAGRVATRVFLGSHWMLEIDSAVGRLRVSQPNVGTVPPGEGASVGLLWTDEDARLLQAEAAHGR
ncbi:MAG TPA: ABC transporter ATP-binding protein [Ramlibacter sp.]|nr:ABC transporter ATP-binding protein [Ramlibacter sp.]